MQPLQDRGLNILGEKRSFFVNPSSLREYFFYLDSRDFRRGGSPRTWELLSFFGNPPWCFRALRKSLQGQSSFPDIVYSLRTVGMKSMLYAVTILSLRF